MKQCPTCRRGFIDSEDRCALDDARLVDAPGTTPAGVGRVLGSYQLVCQLAEGGMGNIYVGRHLQLNRYVAIKLLRPELATRKDNVARFFQEAHTINRLRHPNIVESLDLVDHDAEGAYCVLELLKGQDLETRLARGPLAIESSLRIAVQLADALGKVHAAGVVHRDLKPENLILIERDGREDFVKLIDFGIAQIAREGEHGIVGTAAYMAPEQGVANAPVDGRADIYSLGVLLFEMVTGRHPFPSSTDSEYLVRHADEKPPRPGKLARCPAALEALILRCLEKQPQRRYASADHVAAALRMIDPRGRSSSRAGWLVAGALLVAGGAAAAVMVPPYLASESPTPSSTAAATEAAARQADASAPAPASEPAPSDPMPTIVEIGVVSTPEGASVYREGETVALGVTPFTVSLSRGDKPVKMRFEKVGFRAKTIEVPIAASLEIEVSLAEQREPAAAKSTVRIRKKQTPAPATDTKSKAPTLQREGTIDPFAK